MLVPKYEHFPDVKTQSTAGEPVTWQGNNYAPGVLPTEHVVWGILWELFQLNFAYEFLSLDHHACSTLDPTSDDSQLIQRQALVSKCFPVNPFLSRSLPDHNCGLATNDIEECILYVVCFVQVMQSWKDNKPPIFNLAAWSYQEIPQSQASELEEATTKYYCQQFFNYFGRAALLPHHLFMPVISLASLM